LLVVWSQCGSAVELMRQRRGVGAAVACSVESVQQRSGVDAAVALSQSGSYVQCGVSAAAQWRALWSGDSTAVEWSGVGAAVELVRQ
jgi:hypothetical protein